MIKPIGNKLVIRLKAREETSKGGIHIPQGSQHAEEWGVVVAKGDGVTQPIEVDDVIYISATQGTHYKSGGEDFIIIEDDRIQCKLTA
tara:strand:+ start:324 stop:587 length:264 start_codon:yes stop_codon:yes gene_type:complete